ncbi:uncharacterized protein N7477_002146 [Penicillium maclennaniae]|uniref:uncharacterized protein n=1 Tax=Penicillium maclennaniae TaxID=1343394 RepID=UPI00254221D8|nr:uncharacterized protein N7477_002146 [Penicillium maclennaniae]KAJ5676513.1 hypothetical protein N7477_002146 [Penicillium maclennaniae]
MSFSLKEGWHPKGKDGKKESWRGDFKGINQVAGWMGKGKDASEDKSEHVSKPLSALKDPSSFGPPPKHINYHGAGALPYETTPDRRGMGASPSQEQINYQNYQQQQALQAEEEAAQKPAPPPVPYRVNTTGLSTDNLPAPPVRRLDSPRSGSSARGPQVPPRVPPRNGSPATNAPPPPYSASTPSASQGYINQEATSRLSNAGVSVPALGIGETNRPSSQTSTSYTESAKGKMNDLQSRFSQMRTDSGSSSPAPASTDRFPRTSTNPDASLPPAPGFRERHADKIDMVGVTSRFNTFVEDRKFSANANKRIPRPPSDYVSPSPVAVGVVRPAAPVARATPVAPVPSRTPDVQAQAQRKRPPPPPPKKAEFRAPAANNSPASSASPPPPVPMSSKPR